MTSPAKSAKMWLGFSKLHEQLHNTGPLFEIREKAWSLALELVNEKRIEKERQRVFVTMAKPDDKIGDFTHDGIAMEYSEARYLCLSSYMVSVWSIYDRLTNVCGRLSATQMVQNHVKQNPKLVEDFLLKPKPKQEESQDTKKGDRDVYGNQLFAFSMQAHIREAYAWPGRVSYAIRNWLVHEGCSSGSINLFNGNAIADGVILHSEAIKLIEKLCLHQEDDNGDPLCCCLKGHDSPWRSTKSQDCQEVDLLQVLKAYNAELDIMFVGLLKWCVNSFSEQIKCFGRAK
jgi:hypothetical protein